MSDGSILTEALRLSGFYEDQDRAFEASSAAHRAEELALNHIRASFDALTWLQPRTPEESFIVAVVIGAKIFGNEIDDELLTIINRMMRYLIRGMHAQLTAEQLSSLPKWVLDGPEIAMRVRLNPDQADEASLEA